MNGKNHLAADKIVSGGIDPRVRGVAHETLNDLKLSGIVVPKYGKPTPRQKYALNDHRVQEVEHIVKDGVFPKDLMAVLMRDKSKVPRDTLTWDAELTSLDRTAQSCPTCGADLTDTPGKCAKCGPVRSSGVKSDEAE